jgi:CHAT domain-containing protein
MRRIRSLTDAAMVELEPCFKAMYSRIGWPSVPPEQMLRALLLQILYTARSEQMPHPLGERDFSHPYHWAAFGLTGM